MKPKRKIVDFDPGLAPWEQEEEEKAEKIANLQREFIEREKKDLREERRKKRIEETTVSVKDREEITKKAERIKKLYALDYWMRCFNKVSYCNEVSGQALFHVCLGQALNTFKIYLEDDSSIDWRIHFLWIQDSSSGKGRAMNFVNRVFQHPKFLKNEMFGDMTVPERKKFVSHKLGRMNAASLINTYLLDSKGNITKDDNGTEILKYGIVESNDFIFSEEGRSLLENSRESFELQEIIMTALETIGSINNVYTKQLVNYEKPCQTRSTASFAVTTRPFGKVKQTLVESGLIQRFMFYPRKLSFEEREHMNKLSSFAFKSAKKKSSFKKDFNELVTELNKIMEFGFNNFIDFNEDKIDDLLGFLHEKMMWFTRDVEEHVPSDTNRYILQSFVGRFKENMVIMAFHSACMRFSKYVERQDLQYAFDFFKTIYESQKIWVSLSVEEDISVKREESELRKAVESLLKRDLNQSMTLPDLIHKCARKFGKDYNAMRYHIMKFAKGTSACIEIDKEGSPRNAAVKWLP